MKIAVFGLGEAGSSIAAGLATAGVEVAAFDPADVGTPEAVSRCSNPADAASGARLVLGITAASDAATAMSQAWEVIGPPAIYADLATATPELEEELADIASRKEVPFVDVALMAPVPGRGLATPSLAAGTGAAAYATLLNGLGGDVEAIGDVAGAATARKLMRSVVIKGLAALLSESLAAAAARSDTEWLWDHLVGQLTELDQDLLRRLLTSTREHSERRLHEMEAAEQLLVDLGVDPTMTRATAAHLRRVRDEGPGMFDR